MTETMLEESPKAERDRLRTKQQKLEDEGAVPALICSELKARLAGTTFGDIEDEIGPKIKALRKA